MYLDHQCAPGKFRSKRRRITRHAKVANMSEHHKVGDHVEVVETPKAQTAGEVGRRGVVLEVRISGRIVPVRTGVHGRRRNGWPVSE